MASVHHLAKDAEPVTQEGDRTILPTGPLEDLKNLQREVRGIIHDQLQLVALEVRLAARSLMTMIAAAFCIGALLVLVWIGLMTAVGLLLIGFGIQPALAVLVVTALTSILVVLLFRLIRRRSRDLGLPATLRALNPMAREDRGLGNPQSP